jgi:hypothetical protein
MDCLYIAAEKGSKIMPLLLASSLRGLHSVGTFPFADLRLESLHHRGLVREIRNPQTFALQDAEPLLHLIHP